MAKAKGSSGTKSDRKKPAEKGSAAKPKAGPVGSKKAATAKDAKKPSASPAKKSSARSTAATSSEAKTTLSATTAYKPSGSSPSKAMQAAAKEPEKKAAAPAPEQAPARSPVQQAQTGPAKASEPAKAALSESAPPLSAPVKEEPKPAYEAIGPNTLDGFQLPAVYGKAGVFGGPKDRSAKPDDKLALPTGLHFQYERYRSLNPKSFYCAMRWDYRQEHKSTEEGKRWWANKKLLVANPANGRSVAVRAV